MVTTHGNSSSLNFLRPYPNEEGPKHWTKERHQFLMELKQEVLTFARSWGADYVLVRNLGLDWASVVSIPDRNLDGLNPRLNLSEPDQMLSLNPCV